MKSRLNPILGESLPLFSNKRFWVSEFKRGRTETSDELRSGRPKTTTTPEIVDTTYPLVLEDRLMKGSEIDEPVGISSGQVVHILLKELVLNHLSARWMPHLLNPEQERIRVRASADSLQVFKQIQCISSHDL